MILSFNNLFKEYIMNTIQAGTCPNSTCACQPINPKTINYHVDRVNYLLQFLDPSSRAPGIIGMISWDSLKEGLLEQKSFFNDALKSSNLSLQETDIAHNMIAKIDMALERIS